MGVLRANGLDAFLRRPDQRVRAILFYGADAAGVNELARRTTARFAGSADDAFAVVRLDEAAISSDPGRLADEFAAISMFGGNRVIWISGAEGALGKAIEPLLNGKAAGNFIVVEAGTLSRGSPLRALFEKSDAALVVALYEAKDADIEAAVRETLSGSGLTIEPTALARLVSLAGRDRGAAVRETEKLSLYCAGLSRVTLADVDACCSSGGEAAIDHLIDLVFMGKVGDADSSFAGLLAGGTDAGRIAGALQSHAVRLEEFKVKVAGGQGAESVVRAARPVVFFSRVQAVTSQVQNWPLADLLQAARVFSEAVARGRRESSLAAAIVGRAVLWVARKAQGSGQGGR